MRFNIEIHSNTLCVCSIVLACFAALPLEAADAMTDVGACAQELKLPMFSVLARSTNPAITVTIRFHVDQHGRADRLVFAGGEEGQQADVRFAIEQSRFRAECVDRLVELRFTYEIAGEPTFYPSIAVSFRSPNHFVMRTHPLMPNIDRTRPPNTGK